jgi:hypothetical protein
MIAERIWKRPFLSNKQKTPLHYQIHQSFSAKLKAAKRINHGGRHKRKMVAIPPAALVARMMTIMHSGNACLYN